jgi:hypothetical protein
MFTEVPGSSLTTSDGGEMNTLEETVPALYSPQVQFFQPTVFTEAEEESVHSLESPTLHTASAFVDESPVSPVEIARPGSPIAESHQVQPLEPTTVVEGEGLSDHRLKLLNLFTASPPINERPASPVESARPGSPMTDICQESCLEPAIAVEAEEELEHGLESPTQLTAASPAVNQRPASPVGMARPDPPITQMRFPVLRNYTRYRSNSFQNHLESQEQQRTQRYRTRSENVWFPEECQTEDSGPQIPQAPVSRLKLLKMELSNFWDDA